MYLYSLFFGKRFISELHHEHGTLSLIHIYHEPWTYGPEALANFIKYDSLRYTLIPYIYSNAYQLYKTARPMMTPLVMDYPQDENTYQLTRQYMFGPWMMVCPVTTKGALSPHVYFPGGEWFDYETGERYEGDVYKRQQVESAKKLGLNMLNFHRTIGHSNVSVSYTHLQCVEIFAR